MGFLYVLFWLIFLATSLSCLCLTFHALPPNSQCFLFLLLLTFLDHLLTTLLVQIHRPSYCLLAFAQIVPTQIHRFNSERVGFAYESCFSFFSYENFHLLFLFLILVYSLYIIVVISISIHFPENLVSLFFV